MSAVVELCPRESAAARSRALTSTIGMVVALGSFGILFACLLFMYAALRSQAVAWPPPGLPELPLFLPLVNTGVIAGSSAMFVLALDALEGGRRSRAVGFIASTFALGCVFVGLQLLLWSRLADAGITMRTGALGTVVYVLTALHALHVVGGILALAYWLAFGLRDVLASAIGGAVRGGSRGGLAAHSTMLRLCGMYWHFVGVVWVVMFVTMFLL
ncbi:MAG: hypothetical protein EXR75_13065 [Myxococcales bacterium]|nr:hypothetical protein [Myxococcales bacterium]